MKRNFFALIVGCSVFVLTSSNVFAQATAQISGTAKDRTGAVLPGVEITVTQTDTAATRSTVTNETGSYVLSNLPIGPYRLETSLPGFRTFAQTGIVLEVNASPEINPVLEVGCHRGFDRKPQIRTGPAYSGYSHHLQRQDLYGRAKGLAEC